MSNILSSIATRVKKKLNDPFSTIRRMPRYTPGTVTVKDTVLHFPDAASLVAIYDEIFDKQVYRFEARSPQPLIIDCGANIGISALYFKTLYPDSQVIAFEPDTKVFGYLQKNTAAWKDRGIALVNKGVWREEGELQFLSEGADSGHVVNEGEKPAGTISRIQVDRLSKYIDRPVDFLKIDIEGAELEVLREIEQKLPLVHNLFIEYHSFTGQEQQLDQLLQILSRQGMRYYIYAPTTLRHIPFMDKGDYNGMDGMLNICATRQ